jgi:RHS repeat-associated protein
VNIKSSWKINTSFFYSGPEVLAEFDSKGKLDASYTAGPGIDNLISFTRHNGQAGRNRPVSYFYASDALGSVRQIMDDRGREVNSYSYTPFGVAYNVHEKVEQPYRYTGRRWDPNVGKLWYRSRHYAPGVGRFGQADKWQSSVMNPVGHHPFTYVRNNPVIYVDPMGRVEINKPLTDKELNSLTDFYYAQLDTYDGLREFFYTYELGDSFESRGFTTIATASGYRSDEYKAMQNLNQKIIDEMEDSWLNDFLDVSPLAYMFISYPFNTTWVQYSGNSEHDDFWDTHYQEWWLTRIIVERKRTERILEITEDVLEQHKKLVKENCEKSE